MRLCGGRVVGSMTVPSASPPRKPGDVFADQFPAGLRVLVVDDDPTCLLILERMLASCQYEVTKCNRAESALNELRRKKNGFDVVISDVHMPDMDGFKLLELIGLEMDLPVIMMSADDGKDVVMKGIIHGACDYLIKPVRMEALKTIWQHLVRKKKNEWKDLEQSGSLDEGDTAQKIEDVEYSSPMSDGKSSKRKVDDEDTDDRDDASTMKKARVVWSVDLHHQFVAAVNHLGIEKAFPKKILDLMNVPGLTRENVASHLQKYRLYLRRLSGVSHHPGLLSSPFMMSPQDPGFGTISHVGRIDLQTLAAAGQYRGPTFAAGYQPGLSRSTTPRPVTSSMPFVDQRNHLNHGNPKFRFAEEQHLQQLSNTTSKQANLLHGIPTTMEMKQLAGFQHQSAQSMGNLNMQTCNHGDRTNSLLVPNVQPQTRSWQLMNESSNINKISQIQSSMGHSISPTGATTGIVPRTGIPNNGQAIPCCAPSQSSSAVDFSVNHAPDMTCNSFHIGSNPMVTTSKGLIQAKVNSNVNGPSGFGPNYDMFTQLHQKPHKPLQWKNSSSSYGVPQHTSSTTNNIDMSPSILQNNQSFSSSPKLALNGNSFAGHTLGVSTGTALQQGSSTQIMNNALIDNASSGMKAERVQELSPGNNLFQFQFADDDLMSAFLKQQEGTGSVEGDFDFDVCNSLDNIPV